MERVPTVAYNHALSLVIVSEEREGWRGTM